MKSLRILANDGIHPVGKKLLEEAGHEVITDKIAQEELPQQLNNFDAIIVRSATKVRQALIDLCPNLKIIGRAGVGMDNIDVDYARSVGRKVFNTPAASSRSVAELVFSHMFALSRDMHKSNRQMPVIGDSEFSRLKKAYSQGIELKGKTLGLIGLGRIGCEAAKIAFGLGMEVLAHDPFVEQRKLQMEVGGQTIDIQLQSQAFESVLKNADFITLHVPSMGEPLINAAAFNLMKDGVIIINAARGGVIDEQALQDALSSSKVRGAGLDVFVNEPKPDAGLLSLDQISLSPHIGASTLDAQKNIGINIFEEINNWCLEH